jgi:hypothetical protein
MPDPSSAMAGFNAMQGMRAGQRAQGAARDASAATLKAARDAELLNRERYAEAQGYLNPYIGRSNIAAQQLQAEMGLPQWSGSQSNTTSVPGLESFGDPNMGPSEDADTLGPRPDKNDFRLFNRNFKTGERYDEALADWEYEKALGEISSQSVDPYQGQQHEYKARDISQIPGYQAAMDESLRAAEQSAISSGSSAYGGRRLEAAGEVGAGVQQSYYTNYMNMLQNIANPTVATNLAGMGVGQGQAIGQQNIASQGMASNYNLQGTAARNAATADMMGGITNAFGAYMGTPGGSSSGTTPVNANNTGGWSL